MNLKFLRATYQPRFENQVLILVGLAAILIFIGSVNGWLP